MRSLIPGPRAPTFNSFARATAGVKKTALLLFSIAVLLAGGAAVVHGQFALDGFDPNADGTVRVAVVQPDGKILIGGDFTNIGTTPRNHIARLNPDGTLDPMFDANPSAGADGPVYAIAVQPDGQIIIGGSFSTVSGKTRHHIARLDEAGIVDPDFDPNTDGSVYAIAVQASPDHKILIGGDFIALGPPGLQVPRPHIARLNATGNNVGLPDVFEPDANDVVWSIVLQGNGQILVGGEFTSIGGQLRNRIARLIANGPLTGRADLLFDPDANDTVLTIAVEADGKILAGGFFNDLGSVAPSIGRQPRNRIARLNPITGDADSFDPNANGAVRSIVVQADGRILAGGDFNGNNSMGTTTRNYIARLDSSTGLAEDEFDPNANEFVFAIAAQADGKIVVGGTFHGANSIGGQTRNSIARLEINGLVDQTLLDPGISTFSFPDGVHATAIQPDGKILIGGKFHSVFGQIHDNIARLNADGTLDTDFNASVLGVPFPHGTVGIVYSIAVQKDGMILVGGFFANVNFVPHNNIVRLTSTGEIDSSFDPNNNGTDGAVYAIAVQEDSEILVGGAFTEMDGVGRSYIGRLDIDGRHEDDFHPDANAAVYSITVQADRRILIGGAFTMLHTPNGVAVSRSRIARLDDSDGSIDDIFTPSADGTVYAVAVQPDGKVLLGGEFTAINAVTCTYIARLDATTGVPDTSSMFKGNADYIVHSIAVQGDRKIVVGGEFSVFGSGFGMLQRNNIARLDTLGVPDSFDAKADSSIVRSIALQADGKIVAGGDFINIDGQMHNGFARLSNDIAALQNLAVKRTTFFSPYPRSVTWTRDGSSPQFTRVTFEYSDTSVNYTPLGHGTWSGSNWVLANLNFPTGVNFYVRARGFYRSGDQNGSESITESVRNAFIAPIRALNISTRAPVGSCCAENSEEGGPLVPTGSDPAIGGFIITGSAPKRVLLRAIGPSLTVFGVPGALQDPVLELHGPGTFVTITNNNWRETQEAEIQATGLAPTNDFESAIAATLAPGPYTGVVTGNGTSGVGLIEVYDLDEGSLSKLANISTRAFVGTGDNIVIAGFILGNGDGDSRIVVRGIGPSLIAFGVPNTLANPTLELRDSDGALLVANNDWQDDPVQATELTVAGLAPTNGLESAVAMTLPPGPYTALLRGLNNGTGVGLVEVYDRGAP
jgi:uncharacterized delta-60 repeat protein